MAENKKPQTNLLVTTEDKDAFALVPNSVTIPTSYTGPITASNFIRNYDADPAKTYTVEVGMVYKDEPVIVKITGVSGESFAQGFQVSLTPAGEEK